MTADQRVTNAREYISYARHIKVADLPYPALTRMAAELRRQLGQVLDVVTEAERSELDDAQREVLSRALGDAIWWHTDTSSCDACIQSPSGVCTSHAEGVSRRDAYIRLARELGIETEPGAEAVYVEMNAEPPHPPRTIADYERLAPAGQLAAIRAVLARFDWERDDRQYALEEIERIAGGDAE